VEYDANKEASVGVKSGKELTRITGQSIIFFSLPTPAGAAIEVLFIVLTLTIFFLFYLSRRRKRWIKSSWVDYSVLEGDDLISIAKKRNVSWKIIAKVNKLKPPYTLKENDKIKVPPMDK
jgi:hypothetical protein